MGNRQPRQKAGLSGAAVLVLIEFPKPLYRLIYRVNDRAVILALQPGDLAVSQTAEIVQAQSSLLYFGQLADGLM